MSSNHMPIVRLVSYSSLLLFSVSLVSTGASAAPHRSSSHHSDSDTRWREEWKRQWRATHPAKPAKLTGAKGATQTVPPVAAPTLTLPKASVPAQNAAPKPAPASYQPPASPSVATPAAHVVSSPASKAAAAAAPNAAPASKGTGASPKTAVAPTSSSFAGLTKPDGAAPGAPGTLAGDTLHTQDSPTAAIGDSGRLLFYLVPMLLVTVGGLRLLRGYHEKHGQLPGFLRTFAGAAGGNRDRSRDDLLAVLNGGRPTKAPASKGFFAALLGGHNLNLARQKAGGSIRVIESVPLGGNALHLVSVQGRTLLLGAGGAGVNLLTELGAKPTPTSDDNDFRALLRNAVDDMDALDLSRDETPNEVLVGALDSAMLDTSDTLAERIRRLRTVSEAQAMIKDEG